MSGLLKTLIKPDWDDNPKRSEILHAANLLQIVEYIYNEQQRRRRSVLYATIIAFVFIATHYMAINYVEDEESASFYPPYIEKQVVYPELYKEKK